jgi:hypothetical protein
MGGRWTSRTPRVFAVALAGALLMSLSACGNASTTAKVVSSPTAISTPTATPTPALIAPALCGTDGGSPVSVTGAGTSGIYAADFEHLPDEWTLTPHSFPRDTQYPAVTIGSGVLLYIYPSIGTATQPGIICGVTVRIKAFQALSGPVPNVYHECVDQVYLDPGGYHPSTACPAFPAPSGEAGLLTLPSSAVGSTVTAPMDGLRSDFSPDPNHPAQILNDMNGQLRPYLGIDIEVPVAGTYTFAISLRQNRTGPTVTMSDVTDMLLFKQALHERGGGPCTTPGMQAQLPPPTNPPTQLICPGPPPQ